MTGLRFIAAAAVVLHHMRPPQGTPKPLALIIEHGYVGVPLFFMLSGVVLAWNYPDLTPKRGRKMLLFYIARVARVMPLYWVMLAYIAIVRHVRGTPQSELWRHVLGIQTWSGDLKVGASSYIAPAWSINVELFLYLLFPFLVPIVARAWRSGRPALLAIFAFAFCVQWALILWFTHKGWAALPASDPSSGHRWLYRNPLCRLPDFVMGMSLAFLIRDARQLRARTATLVQVALAVIILAVAAININADDSGLLRAAFYGGIWALPFAALLFTLAVGPEGLPSRFLATGPMLTLGAASYALYLTHRPLQPGFYGDLVRDASGPGAWALMLMVLLMAMFVAEGAHRYIEAPARSLIVGFARRHLGGRRTAEPPPPDTTPPSPPADPEPVLAKSNAST